MMNTLKWCIALCITFTSTASLAQGNGGLPSGDRYLEPGPHGSGVSTVTLFDASRNTPPNGSFGGSSGRNLVVEVWYPAATGVSEGRDVAPASLPQGSPLVVHGHGLGSSRLEIRYAAVHLASHGFTVAAVDFPLSNSAAPGGPTGNDIVNQAGDVVFVALNIPNVTAAFAAEINPDLTALSGYSLGGATALLAGPHPVFDVVSAFAPAYCPIAQAGVPFAPLDKPTFIMGGTEDAITLFDLNAEPAFANNLDPRYLVEIADGSHAGFLDNGSNFEGLGVPKDAFLCSLGFLPVGGPCRTCDTTVIVGDQLLAARQRELAKVGLLAFLDGLLLCHQPSVNFLGKFFERSFDEIDVTFSGKQPDIVDHCHAL